MGKAAWLTSDFGMKCGAAVMLISSLCANLAHLLPVCLDAAAYYLASLIKLLVCVAESGRKGWDRQNLHLYLHGSLVEAGSVWGVKLGEHASCIRRHAALR